MDVIKNHARDAVQVQLMMIKMVMIGKDACHVAKAARGEL